MAVYYKYSEILAVWEGVPVYWLFLATEWYFTIE